MQLKLSFSKVTKIFLHQRALCLHKSWTALVSSKSPQVESILQLHSSACKASVFSQISQELLKLQTVPETLVNQVTRLKTGTLSKKKLLCKFFLCKFANFLKIHFQ